MVGRAYGVPNFAKLIQGGRFVIAVVTPAAGKKTLIERALADEPASPVRYRVEVLDELGKLLINAPAKLRTVLSEPGPGRPEGRAEEVPRDETDPR